MINNINTIQNSTDYQNLQDKVKEYTLQSLANLGSRLSIAGDGIVLEAFSVSDLVSLPQYTSDNYAARIRKSNDNFYLEIIDKENLKTVYADADPIPNTQTVLTASNIKLDESINGVEVYAQGFIDREFIAGYDLYSFSGVTKNKVVEIVCDKIKSSTSQIEAGFRIVPSNDINGTLVLLYIIKTGDTYKLMYKKQKNTDVDPSAILSKINEYLFVEKTVGDAWEPVELWADEFIGSFFSTVSTVVNSVSYGGSTTGFSLPSKEQTLNQKINYFAYDLNYLYKHIKTYNSDYKYFYDNTQLRKQILVALCEMICENSTTATEIYLPLDFKFNYACNSNNKGLIYYNTYPITVEYHDSKITADFITEKCINNICCFTDTISRTTLYNYSVIYEGTDVVNIKVVKEMTMPYIDGEGYWVLDDVQTTVYAKGVNAGNPNIIIVENSGKEDRKYTIVSGANKKEILDRISWKTEYALVEPIGKINLEDLKVLTKFDYFKVACHVPDIKSINDNQYDEWLELLDNSIIMNISNIDCFDYTDVNYTEDDVLSMIGKYGVVTTMWAIDIDKEEPQYEYLRKLSNRNVAMDWNYITNTNNIVKWSLENTEFKHPDRYEFTYLTFDASYIALKNNTLDENEARTYVFGNMQGKGSADYNASNYNNELNILIKYNDLAKDINGNLSTSENFERNNIDALYQTADNRFFDTSFTKNGGGSAENTVTNSLYTYIVDENLYHYEDYVPNYNVPSLDLSEILTRNQTLLNRLNLLSFDKDGKAFYSYIGSTYTGNKDVLTIGSSDTNINMGSTTLIDASEKNQFAKQSKIAVDFDEILLNGYTYIQNTLTTEKDVINKGITWKLSTSNGVSYWTTHFIPTGRYIYESSYIYSSYFDTAGLVKLNTDYLNTGLDYVATYSLFNEYIKPNNKLFAVVEVAGRPSFVRDNSGTLQNIGELYPFYIGDGLYIPEAIEQLGLGSNISEGDGNEVCMDNIIVTSNKPLIKYGDTAAHGHPYIMLMSSAMLYDKDYYRIEMVSPSELTQDQTEYEGDAVFYKRTINSNTYNTVFTGSPITISYWVDATNRINIDFHENENNFRLAYTHKINFDYINN